MDGARNMELSGAYTAQPKSAARNFGMPDRGDSESASPSRGRQLLSVQHIAKTFGGTRALRDVSVCDLHRVPGTDIYQFFISGPDGVRIEFQGRISAGG
jgi:hypothetical protein